MKLRNATPLLLVSSACLLCCSVSRSAAEIRYAVTDLGTLGGTISYGIDINGLGQVTGTSYMTEGFAVNHAFVWTPTTPNGTTGTMIDLGTLGGTNSLGRGINDNGYVAGESDLATVAGTAALLYDGTLHQLGTLGGSVSWGWDINNRGQMTGNAAMPADHGTHAFLWTPAAPNGTTGEMYDLGTLGGTSSYGFGINDSGLVTGASDTSEDAAAHAFLWTPTTPNGATGTMHDLGTLGGTLSIGWGINANGQVTGLSRMAGDNVYHAFLYDGRLHDLGTLGGPSSSGNDINAVGQIVGEANTAIDATTHAFLYTNVSGMVDLNSLIDPDSGWTLTIANGINDVGQITGQGDLNGETHAFLLTPVPEPNSLALVSLASLAGFAFHRHLRKKC